MAVQVDDVNPAFVRDSSPSSESNYTARFYFDPNGLALNSGNFTIFRLHGLSDPAVLVVDLGYQPGAEHYQLVVSLREDDGEWVYYPVHLVSDGPHALEISWGAASEPGAADGWIRYWIDGELAFEDLAVANGGQRVTAAELGVRNVPDVTAQGVICFDAFASATGGYLGLVAGVHGCSAEPEQGGGAGDPGSGGQEDESPPVAIFLPFAANGAAPVAPPAPPEIESGEMITYTTVITYAYDALYRLTGAFYDDGNSYAYQYDSVGNRTELQHCLSGVGCNVTSYTYDVANRLTSVDAGVGPVSYMWDGNGNLRDDGVNEYGYDSANRLTSFDDGETGATYTYNGLGDRMVQTMGVTTTLYTLDLAVGLTQVLADGESAYLYGNMRLAQDDGNDREYFLGDALGSVRQLVDGTGEPILAQAYKPYGEELSSDGSGATNYGFTGEWTDRYIKLVYLRSRYYAPETGRFQTRDVWEGDSLRPMSLNGWQYVYANPVNLTDPSGHDPFYVSHAIEATIQIRAYNEGKSLEELFSCPERRKYFPDSFPIYQTNVTNGLGTLIKYMGDVYLYTHNHFQNLDKKDKVDFLNARGEMLGTVEASIFRQLLQQGASDQGNSIINTRTSALSILNPGVISINRSAGTLPVTLIPRPGYFGNPDEVSVGDTVLTTKRFGNIVSSQFATVRGEDAVTGVNRFLLESTLFPFDRGDSGGGLWFDGRVIGNNWTVEMIRTIDPNTGEILSETPTTSFQAAKLHPAFRSP